MKQLISLLMLISVSAYAQDDCSYYVKMHEDRVENKKYYVNNQSIAMSDDGYNGFGMIIMKNYNSVILSIKAVEKGVSRCINDNSTCVILFTDGTRLELKNNNDFNCKSEFTLYFLGHFNRKYEYECLITKDVDIIRVYASTGYVQRKFTKEEQDLFRNTLKCINQ